MLESLGARMTIGVVTGAAMSAGVAYGETFAEDVSEEIQSEEAQLQGYEVTGGETAEGIATRYGLSTPELIAANPHVNFSALDTGEMITIPPKVEDPSSDTVVTEVVESVAFSNGMEVVVTSGQMPQTESSVASIVHEQNPTVQEPTFGNLPFQQQAVDSEFIETISNVDTAFPSAAMLANHELTDNQPISITTNAASRIEIAADGAISIEVTGEALPAVAHVQPQTVEVPVTTMNDTMSVVQPVEQPVAIETQPTVTGTYKEYAASMTSSAEPPEVLALKDVSVYKDNGLLQRTVAYPEKMTWLKENTTAYVTPGAYSAFVSDGIDSSLSAQNIFEAELPGTKLKDVQCYAMHWMAGDVTDPKMAAQAMLNRDVTANVQLMTMPDGTPYLITGALDDKAHHAGIANDWCVGNEIAGEDLLDFTPQQTVTNIMLTVLLHREYGMPLVRDIAAIEAQPINMYGDYVPIERSSPEDFAGPIGHLEVEDANKLDPTVMYVNYVYEEAFALNALLDQQVLATPVPPYQEAIDSDTTSSLSIVPQTSTSYAGALSIAQLLSQPILTEQQVSLQQRAEQSGFVANAVAAKSPDYVVDTESAPVQLPAPSVEHETELEMTPLLSSNAHTYVVRHPVSALQTSTQSVQNGGELGYEEAYGPALHTEDVYIYLRQAGATHEEAIVLTAVSARETGLRPGAVGDLKVKDGMFMPSYGLFQIRDLKDGNPLRDPAANLDPQQAASNALLMLRQSGGGPWEVAVPDSIDMNSLFHAIRLPERNMDNREQFDARMKSVANDVIQAAQEIQLDVHGGVLM